MMITIWLFDYVLLVYTIIWFIWLLLIIIIRLLSLNDLRWESSVRVKSTKVLISRVSTQSQQQLNCSMQSQWTSIHSNNTIQLHPVINGNVTETHRNNHYSSSKSNCIEFHYNLIKICRILRELNCNDNY